VFLPEDRQVVDADLVEEDAEGEEGKGDRPLADGGEVAVFGPHVHADEKDVEAVEDDGADHRQRAEEEEGRVLPRPGGRDQVNGSPAFNSAFWRTGSCFDSLENVHVSILPRGISVGVAGIWMQSGSVAIAQGVTLF